MKSKRRSPTKPSMRKSLTSTRARGVVPNSGPSGVDADASARDTDALKGHVARIRELLRSIAEGSHVRRYNIGKEIVAVEADEGKYGKGAVRKLAAAVGRDSNTLYEYAAVAGAFPDAKEFAKLAKERTSRGVPLSFSHFVVVSTAKSLPKSMRLNLLAQARTDGLSTRQIRKLLPTASSPSAASDSDVPLDLTRRFAGCLARANAFTKDLEAWGMNVERQLGDEQPSEGLIEKVEELLDSQRRLRALADKHIATLEAEQLGIANQVEPLVTGNADADAVTEGITNPTSPRAAE